MTDEEKAIVMAYTGVCTLAGDKLKIFYQYVEDIMGRPVYTHEMLSLSEEIKNKAYKDFIRLCREEDDIKTKLVDLYNTMAIDGTKEAYIQFQTGQKITAKIEDDRRGI